MMQTVQLSIADSVYAATIRGALTRSCAWQIETLEQPEMSRHGALVLDEGAFARLPLPILHPERVVLITRRDPQLLAEAWDAGIVSVVSPEDPVNTVLLAIMAAALRAAKIDVRIPASGISPNAVSSSASISPQDRTPGSKRCKIQ